MTLVKDERGERNTNNNIRNEKGKKKDRRCRDWIITQGCSKNLEANTLEKLDTQIIEKHHFQIWIEKEVNNSVTIKEILSVGKNFL